MTTRSALAWAAGTLVLAFASGCAGGGQQTLAPSGAPSATVTAHTSTASASTTGATSSGPFCRADRAVAWESARQPAQTPPPTLGGGSDPVARGDLLARAADGGEVWFTDTRPASSVARGVQQVFYRAPDGRKASIVTLKRPSRQAGATLVGTHVVLNVSRSLESAGNWELYVWDTVKRQRAVRVDASDGMTPYAPFLLPATDGTELTWLHGRADGARDVHVLDLRTMRQRVVHHGHVGASFIANGLVVWPEAFAPDAPTRLVAAHPDGRPAALPPALTALRDPQEMSTDGRTWAWTTKERSALTVWRTGWTAPRVIARTGEGQPVMWPQVSGETVSWIADATYTADLRSGSYIAMTKEAGSAAAMGSMLRIDGRASSGVSYTVRTDRLPPLPGC